MTTRTSRTHPIRIDEVTAGDAGGRIGITFCPGQCGPGASEYHWERDLATDLDAVARWHPDAVVTLVERHELDVLGVPRLGEQIMARGIDWHHLPIVDVRPPDERFEARWRTSGPMLNRLLRRGGRVLVHCRGGLGRAGTVAARLLVELGVPPDEAVRRVRDARPGAIETTAQLHYVLALGEHG
ncbi:MAG TPA: cyclin-dependent kinase inhibitor 3 family protein [Zeimonas sp.]|nr:cyclin-dependent kinase inhibitor 3 family protein [Zeimonas sp.]